MADFGLAAQVGRGGGGGGMPQQQDPQNRMMQMMQLQQLQQNMMLAREQEARQAQLFGPQLEGKRLENVTEMKRQGLLGAQTTSAAQAAASATRAGTAEVGVLDYIKNTPPEDRAKPEQLDVLRRQNPGAYTVIADQINTARAVEAKARAEGFTAEQKRFEMQRVALTGMSSLLPAVRDQDSYETLYRDFRVVDPTGAKLIGPKYTPENVSALRARIQDLGDLEYGKDEAGNQIVTNRRMGTTSMLAPAGTSSPQMGGAGAAGLTSAPNGMGTPIIDQSARASGFGPAATAAAQKTTATELAKSGVAQAAKQTEQAKELDRAIKEISAAAAPGGLISRSTGSGIGRAIDAAAAYFGTATPGAVAGAELAPIADLALKMIPRFEGPQSDSDRSTYERAAGQIADTSIPIATRQAAARTVVRLMQERRNEFGVGGGGKLPARAVTRTGTLNGRKVVEYSDGKVEYAD